MAKQKSYNDVNNALVHRKIKVVVRPVMMFGLETVAPTKRQEAELEVSEL